MNTKNSHDLASMLADPARAAGVPVEVIPQLLGDIECLKAILWSRLMASQAPNGHTRGDAQPPGDDDLLTVAPAAKLLGMSPHWLYKNAAKLPFTRRVGPRALRFSAKAIRRYLGSRS